MMRGDRCDADCNVANVKWQPATDNNYIIFRVWITLDIVGQCFSTAGPRPGTGPWHQLYRAARGLRKLQYATRFH